MIFSKNDEIVKKTFPLFFFLSLSLQISKSLYKIGYADYMVDETYMDGMYAAVSF